ncbi:5'-3' exoribonuclease 3-like [Typha latifolia]|uniref:5'-3' exoribonuclease 3-like n=1 Tax=Typha latifolia TaxID=4733 RepID=UPI003C2D7FCD
MGVPSFYRWLVGKYPKVVVNAIEEDVVDYSNPNPVGMEYDNLYLDMNGIIHPCFHPEDEISPPTTYDEVFIAIFKYIDRMIRIVRPRKLLYMAIDGVAPRAKMNQQRSRRFRTAKEAAIVEEEERRLRKEFEEEQKEVLPKQKHEVSDSNVITPGTIFMEKLSHALEYYIRLRLNSDTGWKELKVILSDANVPGEGEHKIMSFIRAQRSSIGYDVNTSHCLYGLDADLIFLALASHEIYFSILREDIIMRDRQEHCQALIDTSLLAKEQETFKPRKFLPTKKPYQFLNIWTLREYLELDLMIPDPPFSIDVERIIDDFVFLCLLTGNDFLPHIPSLEIQEVAIDLVIEVYKKMFNKMGGYLIDSSKIKDKKAAYIKVSRVERFVAEVGTYEERIFSRRYELQQKLLRRLMNERLAKEDANGNNSDNWQDSPGSFMPDTFKVKCVISSTGSGSEMAGNADRSDVLKNTAELRIKLKDILRSKQDLFKGGVLHNGTVKLGSPGWKSRYYSEKFSVKSSDEIESVRKRMVEKYMEGLCWVLRYYFAGVCSWSWYYPFYYAPFASDFKCLSCSKIVFKLGSPFKPFDQLMAVLPPQSDAALPKAYMPLMSDRDSTILKFYPTDFEVDTDGIRFLWQGIAKLPFIEEEQLLAATKILEKDLSVDETNRNVFRQDKIFTRSCSTLGLKISSSLTPSNCPSEKEDEKIPIDSESCQVSGFLSRCDDELVRGILSSLLERMEDSYITEDHTTSAIFLNPDSTCNVPRLLENVIKPEKTLSPDDIIKKPLWHEYRGSRPPLTNSGGRGRGLTGSSYGNGSRRDNGSFGRRHGRYPTNNSTSMSFDGPWADQGMGFGTGRGGRGR